MTETNKMFGILGWICRTRWLSRATTSAESRRAHRRRANAPHRHTKLFPIFRRRKSSRWQEEENRKTGYQSCCEGKFLEINNSNFRIESIEFRLQNHVRGIPDYDHPRFGLIRFDRSVKAISDKPDPKAEPENNNGDDFQAFQGPGFSLRKGRK